MAATLAESVTRSDASHSSPGQTVVDLQRDETHNQKTREDVDPAIAQQEAVAAKIDDDVKLSKGRKWFLLLTFAVAGVRSQEVHCAVG